MSSVAGAMNANPGGRIRLAACLCQLFSREMTMSTSMSDNLSAPTSGVYRKLSSEMRADLPSDTHGRPLGFILDDILGKLPGDFWNSENAFNFPLGTAEPEANLGKRSLMQVLGLQLQDGRPVFPHDVDYVRNTNVAGATGVGPGEVITGGVSNTINAIMRDADPAGQMFFNHDAGSTLDNISTRSQQDDDHVKNITDFLGHSLVHQIDGRPADIFMVVMNAVISLLVRSFSGSPIGPASLGPNQTESQRKTFRLMSMYKEAGYQGKQIPSGTTIGVPGALGHNESASLTLNKMLFEIFLVGTVINNPTSAWAAQLLDGELSRTYPGDMLTLGLNIDFGVTLQDLESGNIANSLADFLNIEDLIDYTSSATTAAPVMDSSYRSNPHLATWSGGSDYEAFPTGTDPAGAVPNMATIINTDMANAATPQDATVFVNMCTTAARFYNEVIQPSGFNMVPGGANRTLIYDPSDPVDLASMNDELTTSLRLGFTATPNSASLSAMYDPLPSVVGLWLVYNMEGFLGENVGTELGTEGRNKTRYRSVGLGGMAYMLYEAYIAALHHVWDWDDSGGLFNAPNTELFGPGMDAFQGGLDTFKAVKLLGVVSAWSYAVDGYKGPNSVFGSADGLRSTICPGRLPRVSF